MGRRSSSFGHMFLHFHHGFLLELEFIEFWVLVFGFVFESFHQFKIVDHPWFVIFHHLHYFTSFWVVGHLWNQIYEGFCPIYIVGSSG